VIPRYEVGRKYDAQLILGTARPWKPTAWKRLAAVLDPVFGGTAKAAVRTSAKLGSLGWKDWPTWTRAKSVSHLEVWSPSWTRIKTRPPDAFLQVLDPIVIAETPHAGIASWTLIAVAIDADVHGEYEPADLARALGAVEQFTARRPWARNAGGGFFENSLQDLLHALERDHRTHELRLPKIWKRVRTSLS
jgi:hypothetical protein